MPRIITTFTSPEVLSEKVYELFLGQLEGLKASEDLVYGINMIIDKILENTLTEVAKHVNEADILNISENIIHNLLNAEEIILEISNKKLKAITWLGALLGGIMGILPPLLQGLIKQGPSSNLT